MTPFQFDTEQEFFIDPQRCIGCHACEMACAECETNGQLPMISVDYIKRAISPQTSVQICMHCEEARQAALLEPCWQPAKRSRQEQKSSWSVKLELNHKRIRRVL